MTEKSVTPPAMDRALSEGKTVSTESVREKLERAQDKAMVLLAAATEQHDPQLLIETSDVLFKAVASALAQLDVLERDHEVVKQDAARRINGLKEAIAPFADYCRLEDSTSGHSAPDDMEVLKSNTRPVHKTVTIGDFRRARQTYDQYGTTVGEAAILGKGADDG